MWYTQKDSVSRLEIYPYASRIEFSRMSSNAKLRIVLSVWRLKKVLREKTLSWFTRSRGDYDRRLASHAFSSGLINNFRTEHVCVCVWVCVCVCALARLIWRFYDCRTVVFVVSLRCRIQYSPCLHTTRVGTILILMKYSPWKLKRQLPRPKRSFLASLFSLRRKEEYRRT